MQEVTFGIAILLASGLLFAKLAQLVRLPSVTGFILAGLVLGPSGLGLITMATMGHRLDHFTQIALMLIAFGIGEHIELRRLGAIARDVGYISVVQALGAFVMVVAAVLCTTWLLGDPGQFRERLVLSLLLGAVAVATAPAAILHVVREQGARGPLTATLMAVVAVDDGIAIIIFGMAMSAAHQLVGQQAGLVHAVLASVYEIVFSLLMGVATGLLIDIVLHRLHRRGEMLTGGLALLLLCGETTRLLGLSPLLAGMMAGFVIINRAERDVRLFRALNAFEPPIYVLFFTLAGAHLDLAALRLAGWVGLVYFVARILGKYGGTWLGAILSGAPAMVRNYLGLALVPQAGVAIGLVFMISSDPRIAAWTTGVMMVVQAGVVLSELGGPLLVHLTLDRAGETEERQGHPQCGELRGRACDSWLRGPQGVRLAPWSREPLHPPAHPESVVVFGACHAATARGLARVATILAHHYHALPMSVRILDRSERGRKSEEELAAMFLPEIDEARGLGYPLLTEAIHDSLASGLVSAVEYNDARAVVLAYPLGRNPLAFQKVLDEVAANILCPLVAVRFAGTLSCDRLLVPFLVAGELDELLPVLEALATAVQPEITFLHLLHADCSRREIRTAGEQLRQWLDLHLVDVRTDFRVEAAESRLESILDSARTHNLVIMTAARRRRFRRLIFGSLANSVVHYCRFPVFVVYSQDRSRLDGMGREGA